MEDEEKTEEENIIQETDTEGIKISNDVVAIISGVAVSEVEGVYGMAGGIAGRNFRGFQWQEKPI